MMKERKYPLEPLARLRAKVVEDAARALSAEVSAREAASRRRAGAELAARAHGEAVLAARAEHDARLYRGELCVADLMRADAWEAKMRDERDALDARARDEREKERAAAHVEAHARGALVAREADAEVVKRDRGRYDAATRASGQAAEEDAAGEAFLGQRRGR